VQPSRAHGVLQLGKSYEYGPPFEGAWTWVVANKYSLLQAVVKVVP
jgi:hypothetical protein